MADKPRLRLRPYQIEGVNHLTDNTSALLLLPMGAGKTATVCTWLEHYMGAATEPEHIIIVAPLRVAETVWPAELDMWAPTLTYRVVTGPAARRRKALQQQTDITIVNVENLAWLFEQRDVTDIMTIGIIDELTMMKNHGSKRVKAWWRHMGQFHTRIGMTGTLTANGLPDMYAQLRSIDSGERLGTTLTTFRQRYMIQGFNQWDWKPMTTALPRMTKAIEDIAFTVSDEQYRAQLPRMNTNIVEVDLPPVARKLYEELEREFIAEFEGTTVMTPTEATAVGKLQQMADGFFYTTDETTGEREVHWVHDAKLDALTEILDSQQGAPTLVVYRYQAELDAMRERHHGIVMNDPPKGKTAEDIVRSWNKGDIPILYGHPKSMGHGLNLQHGGNVIVWFGHTWSYEEHEQLNARLLRSGQTRPVFVHYIVSRETIDRDIAKAARDKLDLAETLMHKLRSKGAEAHD